MELLPYSDGDLALTEALECDPEVMRELGGPVAREDIPGSHRRRVETVAKGSWWFTIVPDPPGPAAGEIGIWDSTWEGSRIHEVGWMVLPEFQGQGIATRALEMLLERARSEPAYRRIHAFPGVSNAASNALCRRFGFENTGEHDIKFRDRPLRCNHWELGV